MYDPKELGFKIREARKKLSKELGKEFTTKMLAYEIGETNKWIQKLESGNFYPDWDALNFIAEVCRVDIDFLTGEIFQDQIEYEDAIEGGDVTRDIEQEELTSP